MKQVFDYLESADFAATVCDKEGIVVYQNALSVAADGDAIGRNLFKCHSSKSNDKIRHMLQTGENNTYQIIKRGRHYLIHHSPWYDNETNEVAGLIELSIPLPDDYPTYNRDKHE